jgi:hypothetical protein
MKKRHRVIDPKKARLAAMGGLVNYTGQYIPAEKRCTMCELMRYSVDRTGLCGPCRTGKYDKPSPSNV